MPFPEPPPEAGWVDDDAGPVVRPYAMTSGRTRPAKGRFDLVSIIAATRPAAALGPGYSPEHVAIIKVSQRPISVAEVAAHLDLPISVVRVFLGDLLHLDLIAVRQAHTSDHPYSNTTFEAMLDGLRAL
jgi:Protein of unknown function (DUF742)